MAKSDKHKAAPLAVTMRSLESLVPYARNSRTHSPEQISQISGSIKEFGFNDPIAVDAEGVIIEGHGRVMAARKLGMSEVPVIVLGHMSESQKRAYILAHNKIALNAGWDEDMLRAELDALAAESFELTLAGWNKDEAEKLTACFDVGSTDAPDLPSGDRDPFRQMTFTVHDTQHEKIEQAIKKAKAGGMSESGVNENSNGNALAAICEAFING